MLNEDAFVSAFIINQENGSGRFLSRIPSKEFWKNLEFVKNVIQKKPKISIKKVKGNKDENKMIYELKLKK